MKVILAGGTGFIGRNMTQRLLSEGHRVVLLTRNPNLIGAKQRPGLGIERWDAKSVGPWASQLSDATAVINLAGETIAKRWSTRRKEQIVQSRVDATRALVSAMKQCTQKPALLVNASAVGYYGDTGNDEVSEERRKGTGFLSDTVDRWESEAGTAEALGVRVVMTRTGIVLGSGGGALPRMLPPFKLFMGGPIGSEQQWFPWVHIDDVVGAIMFPLSNRSISGPVNVVAPQPVTMKEFCSSLGKVLHRPSWFPVPPLVLRLALGEMAEMLLTGQRVRPRKLVESGYTFRYTSLYEALISILRH